MLYAVDKQTKEHSIVQLAPSGPLQHYRIIQADANGWIEWHGGECPLPDGTPYETKHVSGATFEGDKPETFSAHWRGVDWDAVIAYRPILDNKPQAPEWDGESWPPPVNSLVESFAANSDGIECEVLAVRGDKVIACTTDTHMAGWITEEDTRPIRTDREKWIESARDIWHEQDEGADNDWGRVYDALKSGELPTPKTDNRH